MPKNNNQVSPLDELAAKMEQETQVAQAAQQPVTETAQPEMVQESEQAQSKAYTPAANEKNLYHVELEKPFYDKRTGKKLSVPSVQKFTEAEYKALTGKKNEKDKSNAEMLGYTVKVLWNPKENI